MLLNAALINNAPLKGRLHLGSHIVLASKDGRTTQTVVVVGFYQPSSTQHYGQVLAATTTVTALTPAGQATTLFYLKIDPSQTGKALRAIGTIAPSASIFNFANISDFIDRFIGDVLLVLTTIASLSLLAGVLIIANAVALAMLERRRELGILKALGYTGRMLLTGVLIENGVVGAVL